MEKENKGGRNYKEELDRRRNIEEAKFNMYMNKR